MRRSYRAPVIKGLSAAVLAALALAGCSQKQEAKPAEPAAPAAAPLPPRNPRSPSRSVMSPRSRAPQAHLGKDNENAARLAIEQMNAKGVEIGGAKVKLELVPEDDQADPKQANDRRPEARRRQGQRGHRPPQFRDDDPGFSKIYADVLAFLRIGSATNPKYTRNKASPRRSA